MDCLECGAKKTAKRIRCDSGKGGLITVWVCLECQPYYQNAQDA